MNENKKISATMKTQVIYDFYVDLADPAMEVRHRSMGEI